MSGGIWRYLAVSGRVWPCLAVFGGIWGRMRRAHLASTVHSLCIYPLWLNNVWCKSRIAIVVDLSAVGTGNVAQTLCQSYMALSSLPTSTAGFALSCPVLSCLALPCPALPCPLNSRPSFLPSPPSSRAATHPHANVSRPSGAAVEWDRWSICRLLLSTRARVSPLTLDDVGCLCMSSDVSSCLSPA
ncbi:hypothetical protein K504DRAFT_170844 [Pleomassaria siparia CBS 279.74]|uniref:Uncharacterized protein n=1 Tax=Pleomassaria siparia CBS 279.74 TaxID=1314801 RepID=A0A6G1JT71_9PLEO|nr:hypothetical protein K504DRAFT_170844 [Pleomassaria siparia CBS 279.74]